MSDQSAVISSLLSDLAIQFGGIQPEHVVKARPDGKLIVLHFAAPSPRIYEVVNSFNDHLADEHPFKNRITVVSRQKRPDNVLKIPETEALLLEISASLTVDKNTFGEDFLNRYTPSVTNLEQQIVVAANHMVYGRRGSGKSSLLAFARHKLKAESKPVVWIAMQTYAGRTDKQAISSVLSEIVRELAQFSKSRGELDGLAGQLLEYGEMGDEEEAYRLTNRLLPRLRQMIAQVTEVQRQLTIFLDDLHVLGNSLQPILLSAIYAFSRGNRTFIKASGIEQLTNLWNAQANQGLQSPHDVTTLKLDHNLTAPDQSRAHIESILDRHAKYCGLPSILYLASPAYVDRLVLSAAAVPRDALSLFLKSVGRSVLKEQKAVSITSLNAAASEAIEEKLKDVAAAASQADDKMLREVKTFCLNKNHRNAFLVKIDNGNASYQAIQQLAAHRFIHLLHEGITPHSAGERYIALMLDYGFYIGIRAAKSVELYPEVPRSLPVKELRKLPIFQYSKQVPPLARPRAPRRRG